MSLVLVIAEVRGGPVMPTTAKHTWCSYIMTCTDVNVLTCIGKLHTKQEPNHHLGVWGAACMTHTIAVCLYTSLSTPTLALLCYLAMGLMRCSVVTSDQSAADAVHGRLRELRR